MFELLTTWSAFLFSSPLFAVIRFLAAVYVTVLVVDLLLLLLLSGVGESYRKNRRGTNLPTSMDARAKWRRITARLDKGTDDYRKAAILEADQMVEKILVDVGYTQPTMGEKIDRLTEQFIDGAAKLREAHAMSVRVIREADLRLSHDEARATLDLYKSFLDDMEVFG